VALEDSLHPRLHSISTSGWKARMLVSDFGLEDAPPCLRFGLKDGEERHVGGG